MSKIVVIVVQCFVLFIHLIAAKESTGRGKSGKHIAPLHSGSNAREISNPFNQDLPDCRQGYTTITTKTSIKVRDCPLR